MWLRTGGYLFLMIIVMFLCPITDASDKGIHGTTKDVHYKTLDALLSQLRKGVFTQLGNRNGPTLRLFIAKEGWEAPVEEISNICTQTALTICNAVPSMHQLAPTVFVMKSVDGPITLSQRGPDNEYLILLNSGAKKWSQISYQFSHEFGHVLCGSISPKDAQQWFEESFCEALSIWSMQQMSADWKKSQNPDFRNYAQPLYDYAETVKIKSKPPADYRTWFSKNRNILTQNAINRDKNRVYSIYLVKKISADIKYVEAFRYLRNESRKGKTDTMEWVLQNWRDSCPPHLKFVPNDIAQSIGVKI